MSTMFDGSDSLIGKSFGSYTIREKHAEGGMAIIYKAEQPALNRLVAIKVLRGELAQDQQFIERFQREAMAVARLSHPNILHVYDAGIAHGVYYIVMDYAEGGSLKNLIAQGPLEVGQAVSIGSQMADALDHAHRQGLIHRDVKPSNILLTREGRPLLADFGVAKRLDDGLTSLTRTGASIGTPEYMAPEQAQGLAIDGRTDIYALGLVLYEMLTGWAPFGGQTPVATLYRQVNEPPPPLHQVNINVPAWLEGVVNRALAKRPDDRYQHASELAQALRLFGMPAAAETATGPVGAVPVVAGREAPLPAEKGTQLGQPAPAPLSVPEGTVAAVGIPAAERRPRRRTRPIVIATLAVLLVALLGGGAWYLFMGRGPSVVATPTPTLAPAPPTSGVIVVPTQEPIATNVPPSTEVIEPTPAPGMIAFTSNRDGNADIYVVKEDGSGLRNLTNSPSEDYWPQWSPDNTKIAFHSYEAGNTSQNSEIYVMDADGKNWIRLTHDPSLDKFPGWSPDGMQIVFASDRAGNYEIYVMRSDGSDVRRLTMNAAKDYYPAWSPDGTYILFDSDRATNGEIYVVNSQGGTAVNLTKNPALDTMASWSPDGTKIAFSSDRSGQMEVWLMDSDGSNPRQLTTSGGSEPRWSPDGTKIVFASGVQGKEDIYVINGDGGHRVLLAASPGRDWDPCWSK